MSNKQPETVACFTDENRLRLLQLMTRRAMAERRSRAENQNVDNLESVVGQREMPPLPGLSERWQLIPDKVSLYEWQKECLPLWMAHGRGTVKVATGGGKTLFALAVAQQLQNDREHDLRLVIVVPTIPLMFQWRDEVRQGNIPDSAIGLMGGSQDLPPASDLRVLICVLNSARERLPEFVAKVRWAERMFLVVDECHRTSAEQSQRIFKAMPKYTLGLSATPERDSESEGLPSDEAYEQGVVGRALGPIIYDFTIKQSLAAGLLTPFEVWHIGLSLSPPEANEHARLSREITELRKSLQRRHRQSSSKQGFLAWCQTQAKRGGPAGGDAKHFISLANRRKRLLYRAKARFDITLGVLSESVTDPEGRAIVFHESIEEIESLFLLADERGLPAVLEHSKLPDSLRAENIDAFRRGIARIIISAKSLVEGFNVPSADLGIIAASSGSVRQRIQSLGRMLRKKKGDREARILVLYIRDTEDEAIYEKADWETIIGAERNRYFDWNADPEETIWSKGLSETAKAPRLYKPPSWEIDVGDLHLGDPYPAQSDGVDLRVDQSNNLRTEDSSLVPAPSEFITAILERTLHRRARCTPAGHLIVRVDQGGFDESDWLFIGVIKLPENHGAEAVTVLRLRTVSGRREIALEVERGRGAVKFALKPGTSLTPEGGDARDQLLEWVRSVESKQGVQVKEIFWDRQSNYWLEIGGEKISHDGPIPPLEFKI
ncbi:MAG: DEAD/DEAH box helicase [Proteobacteria bacterium]|nr:DEAD/DEAH box helicase [Pseudomonadota bacterium]MBU4581765.1 DEAD/DEAH box helicase [Pseudomonadota bacterium]MCG2738711.1 DEAD/DEAH box helicase [Syntrophaceae bacterium]